MGSMFGDVVSRRQCTRFFFCTMLSGVCWALHSTGFLPVQCFHTTLNRVFYVQCYLEPLGQNCTRLLPVLLPVGPWLTDNFYEEINLYNIVWTMLGQHCIGILLSQCYPNLSETTMHKKITCAMLAQSAKDMLLLENNL